MVSKNKKYIFTLKNILTDALDQKYGIGLRSNIFEIEKRPENTSTIADLIEADKDTSLDIVSFLDESKKLFQCDVSMVDFKSKTVTDLLKGYRCYWCRHSFSTPAIGCPIEYVSSKVVKKYHSEVSKDDYSIKENVTRNKRDILQNIDLFSTKNKASITLVTNDYYVTDGIFCSFNCCKAFILDNKHNNIYEHSNMLLLKLYRDMNPEATKTSIIRINPAPSWRMLQEYGGNLTIENFRNNFNKCLYDCQGLINIFKPIGVIYDKKINF